MAAIVSPGIGSGLDVNGIVSQLTAIEREPIKGLNRKEAGYQAQLSALGTLKGILVGFQTTARSLSSLSSFQSVQAVPADASIFTATAFANAAPASYAVEVKQLAQNHKLASKSFQNVTEMIGTGTLRVEFGTFETGFTPNADKPAKLIAIDSASSSLSGIRDAINAAKAGVTASIINNGNGFVLALTSNDTGKAHGLRVTVSGDSAGNNLDGIGLSQLAYDPALSAGNGKNLTQTVAAQDAVLKVDGIDNINKASNTVSDVIQGVTLTLLKKSADGVSTNLAVSRDTANVKSSVEKMVTAYNDLNSTIKDLTAYDPATRRRGLLQGDSVAQSILSQVRRTMSSAINGLGGGISALNQIGVSFQKDGSLRLDSSKLQSAISASDVAGLFATQGVVTDSLIDYLDSSAKTRPGTYPVTITRLATRGASIGETVAGLSIVAGSNDTLQFSVNGVSVSVVLGAGNYASADALALEVQARINSHASLVDAGHSVAVTSSGGILRIVSNRYGSASSVSVTGGNAKTGLIGSAPVETAGVDVAGTINGKPGTGSGQRLTAAAGDGSEGLQLDILGGVTGPRGSVNFSQGYAQQLDKLMDQLLGTSGPVAGRSQGISNRIAGIADLRADVNRRADAAEQRFRAQYAALDVLLGRLRSQSNALTGQLASLPGASK